MNDFDIFICVLGFPVLVGCIFFFKSWVQTIKTVLTELNKRKMLPCQRNPNIFFSVSVDAAWPTCCLVTTNASARWVQRGKPQTEATSSPLWCYKLHPVIPFKIKHSYYQLHPAASRNIRFRRMTLFSVQFQVRLWLNIPHFHVIHAFKVLLWKVHVATFGRCDATFPAEVAAAPSLLIYSLNRPRLASQGDVSYNLTLKRRNFKKNIQHFFLRGSLNLMSSHKTKKIGG